MSTNSEILQEINIRRKDIRSLQPYLNKIAESDLHLNDKNLFEALLDDKDEFIRLFAFKILFERLKLDLEDYKDKIISIIRNKKEDFDLRIECSNGIASRYNGTKNKSALNLFYNLFNDRSENDLLRGSFFECMMRIYGMPEREIALKNHKFAISLSDVSLDSFREELKEIKNIIKT